MRTLRNWFQGPPQHGRTRQVGGNGLNGLCLWLVTETFEEARALANIGRALFPERWCICSQAAAQLIHFNNHDLTTQDEVEKILHTYHIKQPIPAEWEEDVRTADKD